ncbi:MAG: hypothetical protein JWM47_786 [Acidimicrobiales bacterium]|nr:hypothetical protein [Acidimicrobiales bacterium]
MALALALVVAVVGGCTKETGSEAEFCREVKRIPPLETVVTGFVNTDPVALGARLDDAEAAYDALLDAAPGEIRGSVREMNSLVDAVIAAVRRHPDDPEAAASELRKALLSNRGGATASAKVVRYTGEHCGLDLAPSVDETTTTEP